MTDDIDSPSELTPSGNTDQLQQGFLLGPWQIYPDRNLITAGEEQVHLEPKVMEVLLCLARHQGEVVKRDELIDRVWNTVVTDEVLSRAISLLRTCLKDNTKTPVYIQTVPKKGYRLIHPVAPLPEVIQQPEPEPESEIEQKKASRTLLLIAAALLGALLLGLLVWMFGGKGEPEPSKGFKNLAEWFDFMDAERAKDAPITSIAVLPFENLSDDATSDYFGEGLTDEITMFLSKVQGLKVVARRSAYSLRNPQNDIPTVGKLLNVDAVLEGTVRRIGDQLKINAQLSDVKDGYLLWSQSYQGSVEDAFSIQEEVSDSVVKAMQTVTVTSLELPGGKSVQPDRKAYQLYLHGRFLWKLRGEKALRESIALYQQATVIDPDYTRAKLGMSAALVLLPFYADEDLDKSFTKAGDILDSVEPVDDWERSELETIRAFMAMHRWQWAKAEQGFRRAIELAPDNAHSYNWFSQFLSTVGRRQDSLTAALRAKELDGVSPVINDRLGVAYLWLNEEVRAAEHFAMGYQLGFSNLISHGYVIFLLRQQRFHEFRSIMDSLHPDAATKPTWLINEGSPVFLHNDRQKALTLAREAQQQGRLITEPMLFGAWVYLGGVDEVFETFNRFVGTPKQKYLYLEFLFAREGDVVRADSRFSDLAEKAGLADYWKEFGGPDIE